MVGRQRINMSSPDMKPIPKKFRMAGSSELDSEKWSRFTRQSTQSPSLEETPNSSEKRMARAGSVCVFPNMSGHVNQA